MDTTPTLLILVLLQIFQVQSIGLSSKLDFEEPETPTTKKSEKLESFVIVQQPVGNPKGDFESIGSIQVGKPVTECVSGICTTNVKSNKNDDVLLTNVQVQVLTQLNRDQNSTTQKPNLVDVPVYSGSNPEQPQGPQYPYNVNSVPVYQNIPNGYSTSRPVVITPKNHEAFPSKSIDLSNGEAVTELKITNDPNYNNRYFGENAPSASVWITKDQQLNLNNPKGYYPPNNRRKYDFNPYYADQAHGRAYQGRPDYSSIYYNPQLRPNIPNTNYDSPERRFYTDLHTLVANSLGIRSHPGNSFTRVSYPENFVPSGAQLCLCGSDHNPQNQANSYLMAALKQPTKVNDKVEKFNN